jgi:enolase
MVNAKQVNILKITKIHAREILDSRGNPTIEVDVHTKSGFGRAAAPSGASTGIHEALELRDGEKRYLGLGVRKAIDNVNKRIAPLLLEMHAEHLEEIDNAMIALDGTPEKSRLGGNAMVALSMACARAAASVEGKEVYRYFGGNTLPKAMFNILNGGKHAGGKLSIQEFMIIPEAKTFSERLRVASEIYHILGKQLAKKYGESAKNIGDEGGFAPQMKNTKEALVAIENAIGETGYGKKVTLAIDAAASSFFDEKKKKYALDGKMVDSEKMLDFYIDLSKQFRLKSIEDPFFEEDFDLFAQLTKKIGRRVQIVGDDLLVTNPGRIETAIEKKSCNALLLKINQIGTITESITAAKMCKEKGWGIIVSHRSGETEDCFIADFAVGIDAGQIKTGAPARGERTAKYNQLLRIEEELIQ